MDAHLPALGVGLVYAPGLEDLLEAGHGFLDLIEIEPETLWLKSASPDRPYRLDPRAFERLAAVEKPKTVHGVGFPVGGTDPLDAPHLQEFLETIERVGAPWVSEHLSINRVRHRTAAAFAGFLLPPLQTASGVAVAADNIRCLADRLPVPFAFETGANYLRPRPGEMSDGSFFRAVAEEADCGILLDLHNVWANQQNGRQTVEELVAEIPVERVWEIHLAGGRLLDGYWLDAHSGLVPGDLKRLAERIVPLLPNLKAIAFEIVADYIPAEDLQTEQVLDDIRWMKQLWRARALPGSVPRMTRRPVRAQLPPLTEARRHVEDWERALGALVGGRGSAPLPPDLAADPGVGIYRRLIKAVRAGTIVSTLKLTCRLLRLKLGEERFGELLTEYFDGSWPSLFASDEALGFGRFLGGRRMGIDHLDEVLEFEQAIQMAQIDGQSRTVAFQCEPLQMLESLGAGRLPQETPKGRFEVVVE